MDRRFIVRALQGRLAPFASSARVDVSFRALTAWTATNPTSFSRRNFDAWRLAQPDPREFASSSLIRTTFGSWRKAVLAFVPDEGDPRARGLVNNAKTWSRQELLDALVLFAPAEGPLTVPAYITAAREHNDSLALGEARYPLRTAPFVRMFGSWGKALSAAGVLPSPQATARQEHPAVAAGPAVRGKRRVLGAREDYTPERMVQALTRAWNELDVVYMSMDLYDEWARRTCLAAQTQGKALVLPGARTIDHRLGWKDALCRAGIITVEERDRLATGGFSFSDEAVVAALRRALVHFAGPPSQAAYMLWRRQLQGDERSVARGAGLCSPTVASKRFGSWSAALSRAAGDDPALRELASRPTVAHKPGGGRWGHRS